MLQSEYDANTGSPLTALVYKDGLDIRQRFCDIVNSIWGIGIWVEPFTIDEMMDAINGAMNEPESYGYDEGNQGAPDEGGETNVSDNG